MSCTEDYRDISKAGLLESDHKWVPHGHTNIKSGLYDEKPHNHTTRLVKIPTDTFYSKEHHVYDDNGKLLSRHRQLYPLTDIHVVQFPMYSKTNGAIDTIPMYKCEHRTTTGVPPSHAFSITTEHTPLGKIVKKKLVNNFL
jgi:hypothetical protein